MRPSLSQHRSLSLDAFKNTGCHGHQRRDQHIQEVRPPGDLPVRVILRPDPSMLHETVALRFGAKVVLAHRSRVPIKLHVSGGPVLLLRGTEVVV